MADKKMSTLKMLVDPGVPLDLRRRMMVHVCMDDSPQALELANMIFGRLTEASGQEIQAQKAAELDKLIRELKSGPLRRATYLGFCASIGRAEVVLDDGNQPFVMVPEESLLAKLERGSTVFIDANLQAILFADEAGGVETGEVATLKGPVEGTSTVRVEFRDDTETVMRVTADLERKINKGDVAPGRRLLACTRRMMAFRAMPEEKGLSHYQFLVRQAPPDICVGRDVGSPPRYIGEIERHVRIHMQRPDLAKRWRLPKCRFFLLEGVTGVGKTYSVYAVWHMIYQVMSEITGAAVPELPYRVTRLTSAQFLSHWLGQSDKNLDRFFSESEQLAAEEFVAPDGRRFELPVLASIEECDGIARARGEDAIYDRILTTALTRLDKTRPELKSRFIIYVGTTNVPGQVDPAFLRRIGGRTEKFGHLTRRGFVQVLTKRLRDLPLAADGGEDPNKARQRMAGDAAAWLFSPNGSDAGQLELTLAGSAEKIVKFRRDFLTGAVIDRAVEEACDEICARELQGDAQGLDPETLMLCLDRQIRAVANLINPHNVTHYVVVPEGTRVAAVRRIEQPDLPPWQLRRTS